ncbi:hypothetical protein DRO19_00875 [Candidatus Bathyarchaeota archaeon]|nr:MAG: hypothetical protein DRO19_00875 [Candidatus Bathyarchaeota archaeon]
MLIGLIADTHDRLPYIEKAVKRLNEENVELVLHAGDYIAPFTAAKFKELKADLIGVYGNNDGDKQLLKKKFDEIGAEIRGKFAEIIVDGLKIALLHGEETELLNALINAESHDIVVHGHTHKAQIRQKGDTIVVNPGEVCAYLTGKSTIAILDTATKEVRIISLE